MPRFPRPLSRALDRWLVACDNPAMSIWIKLAVGAAVVYAVVALAAFLGQRKLMYFPDTERAEPSEEGLTGVAERTIETPDGHRLVAWYGKARQGKPTLLYFHGNAGNLADRAPRIARFMGESWGVYMLSYRGYGGSTGSPSEAANVADARLAYHALLKEGVPPASIVAYGESLGSGVAVRIAAELAVAGIILDAPFTSISEIAARAYPFLPVRLLLIDRYESTRYIGAIKSPLLILHGARDGIVPVAMGRELARLAPEPKTLVVFPDGNHSDLYVNGNNAIDTVRAWIDRLGGG
jgi:fermentation-respiration switch protein FrsA (DUF1100 family)